MQCIKVYISLSTVYSTIKLNTVQLTGSAQCHQAGVTCHCYSALFAIVVGFHTLSLFGSVMNQNSSWLMSFILTCSPFSCNRLDSAKVYINIVWLFAYHKDIYPTHCIQLVVNSAIKQESHVLTYSAPFSIVVDFYTLSLVGSVMNLSWSWLTSCTLTCSPFACSGLDSAKLYIRSI